MVRHYGVVCDVFICVDAVVEDGVKQWVEKYVVVLCSSDQI